MRAIDGAGGSGEPEWPFEQQIQQSAYRYGKARQLVSDVRRATRDLAREARHDQQHAAQGAVLLLERLFEVVPEAHVGGDRDGPNLTRLVNQLVDLVAAAAASEHERWAWLTRLQGVLVMQSPWSLRPAWERWGDLCGLPTVASRWGDRLLTAYHADVGPVRDQRTLCAGLSALVAAGRHEDVLTEWRTQPAGTDVTWRQHVLAALAALGRFEEARTLADSLRTGRPFVDDSVDSACERALLAVGRREEAWLRHAAPALLGQRDVRRAYGTLAATYPERTPEEVLRLLMQHAPSAVEALFVVAAEHGEFPFALELLARSRCLFKAVNAVCQRKLGKHPGFVLDAQIASLRALVRCPGSAAPREEVLAGHGLALRAAQATAAEARLDAELAALLAGPGSSSVYLRRVLARSPQPEA